MLNNLKSERTRWWLQYTKFSFLEVKVNKMETELLGRNKLSIEKRLVRAKVQLLMGNPFFGTLSYHLKTKEISGDPVMSAFVPTAGVDGHTLFYNKEWLGKHTDEEIKTIVAHEVLHCALSHLDRRGHRNKMKFNAAADFAVNDLLHDAGFTLPEGCLRDERYHNMNAEKIYELLPEQKYPVFDVMIEIGQGGGDEDKENEGKGGAGEDEEKEGKDAGAIKVKITIPTADPEEVKKWRLHVAEAATVARMQGKLPAGIEELLKDILQPKINWREVLRQFLVSNFKNDFSWLPPSKKHIHNGLVLPSLKTEGIGTVVVGVDTSGSISNENLQQFFGEIQSILNTYEMDLHVVQCDAAVQKHDTYRRGDELGAVEIKGRGGTSFVPVFDMVSEENINPVCLIYLTDLWGDFPEEAPNYPVLWAATTQEEVPFGEVIRIEED